MKLVSTNGNQVFSVPNTLQGREFINTLKVYLNSDKYKVVARGRAKNRREKGGNGQDIAPSRSDWLAVYVVPNQDRYWTGFDSGQKSERDTILRLIEHRGRA